MSFTLQLPFKVNANARGHSRWQPKIKLGALRPMTYRKAAALLFKPRWRRYGANEVGQQKLLEAGLVITLTRIAPCALDDHDNLRTACKPLIDGIGDALGLKTDRDPRVTWLYDQKPRGVREYLVEVLLQQRPEVAALPCPTCGRSA